MFFCIDKVKSKLEKVLIFFTMGFCLFCFSSYAKINFFLSKKRSGAGEMAQPLKARLTTKNIRNTHGQLSLWV